MGPGESRATRNLLDSAPFGEQERRAARRKIPSFRECRMSDPPSALNPWGGGPLERPCRLMRYYTASMLELKNISLSFGSNNVLKNVSLEVSSGEIHGLLGENGAGKTTLMNVAAGLLIPDEGQVLVDGRGRLPQTRD